jgi:hypothetical protein
VELELKKKQEMKMLALEEIPESITSTLRRHKSTTLQLTHIRIKPTSSQLLLLLWQPLPL